MALDLATASDQEALACLAVGQVRLGALDEAAITRAALLDATSTPTEQALAIQALLDSLSLVETDNATAIKVSDFDRLDVTGLPRETQFQCAVQVARLAANENNERRRDDELERARALQKTGFETARLFFTEWTCASQHIDSQWFERLDEIRGSVGGDETIAVLSQIESYEYAARGQWLEAEQSNAGFLRAGTAISSPELQWQSKLASAGFAFGRGDLEESERLANDAFTHGMVFALPLAPAARAAHAFCQALHTGSVDKWLDFVENVSPDLLRNTLAMAAVGRARYEVGRVDEAWQIAEPILPTVFKRERRMATSVVAVLAPLIRKRAAPGLRQQCVDLLRRAGDQWTITGAGIAIHGPASRALAILEGDRRTLHRLRHELADTPLWVAALDDDIARIDREH